MARTIGLLIALSLALSACGGDICIGCCDQSCNDGGAALPDGHILFAPLDGGPPVVGCGLAAPAFCESFDAPHPGGRGGDIDETRFAFSRWDIEYRLEASSFAPGITLWSNPDGPPSMCDATFAGVLPPSDVRVCNGQLHEAAISGGFPINSFMVRQPFDFSDGGLFVFDVDAKRNDGWDGHGWWLEVWVTEDPQPIPFHGAPTIESLPRNGIGFSIAPHDNAFSGIL